MIDRIAEILFYTLLVCMIVITLCRLWKFFDVAEDEKHPWLIERLMGATIALSALAFMVTSIGVSWACMKFNVRLYDDTVTVFCILVSAYIAMIAMGSWALRGFINDWCPVELRERLLGTLTKDASSE